MDYTLVLSLFLFFLISHLLFPQFLNKFAFLFVFFPMRYKCSVVAGSCRKWEMIYLIRTHPEDFKLDCKSLNTTLDFVVEVAKGATCLASSSSLVESCKCFSLKGHLVQILVENNQESAKSILKLWHYDVFVLFVAEIPTAVSMLTS